MNEETLAGEVPAPDAVETPVVETPAEASPAPETAETVAADTGSEHLEKERIQKRIDKLTWERGERDRRIAFLEGLVKTPEPKVEEAGTPPTLEEHGFDEAKYQQAVIEYARSVAANEAREAYRQERESEQQQRQV